MVVALQKKCLFIHVPKTGGVSIRHWLSEVTRDETVLWWDHGTASVWWHLLKEPKSFFKFAFVRNPWDRVVSQYFWATANGYPAVTKHTTFEAYVHEGLKNFDSQTKWLTDRNNKLLVDFVGRFEQLEDDLKYVAKRIGVDVRVPLGRLNGSDHGPYRNYYNEETAKIVGQVYADDVEIFQYPILKV